MRSTCGPPPRGLEADKRIHKLSAMQIEPVGVALLSVLLLVGYFARSTFTVALFASLPFGATAIATLTAMGGAPLMLYMPLAGLLIISTLGRRTGLTGLCTVLTGQWIAGLVAFLVIYVVAGALILPRLFAGQTTVLVPGYGRIVEVPLMPVSGNFNQSCYFIASALCFFAFSVLLLRKEYFRSLRVGLFALAVVHAGLCLIDIGGKVAGIGDVLAFVRTAGYAMLTEVQANGFWRIVGANPEASTTAAASATAFAFSFSYWRLTGSRLALALAVVLGALLLFSTSTTGYVVLATLSLVFLCQFLFNALSNRLQSRDIWIVALAAIMLIAVIFIFVTNEHALDPVARLVQGSIIDKTDSASAAERFYWNSKSFMAFLDTGGLGVGLGSSRASSWLIAVLSQLGAFGTLVFAVLVWEILKRPYRQPPAPEHLEIAATCVGIRSATFATIVALLTSGGNADPGLLFFTALAALPAGRRLLAEEATSSSRAPPLWYAPPLPASVY